MAHTPAAPASSALGAITASLRAKVPARKLAAMLESRTLRTDNLQPTQRNIYILPTRPGWMLAITLLVMLVGSINYQLNLGYMLTFLIAGAAVVASMCATAAARAHAQRSNRHNPALQAHRPGWKWC